MSDKRVLVIGSGGREHAICWKLAQSPRVEAVFCLPGNPGFAESPKIHLLTNSSTRHEDIVALCQEKAIDLVMVGPEDPLAKGLGDDLRAAGVKCFGPGSAGAQIEADKEWAKKFMVKYNIPTARFAAFTDAEKAKSFIRGAPFEALVVKASGLAAGKGVVVATSREEACAAADEMLTSRKFGAAGSVVVIEEKLTGEEVSVLAFVDSTTVKVLLPAQDHKRLRDGDMGPNTGGMGAYCPCPLVTPEQMDEITRDVLQKAVAGLRNEGIPYCGILYAGMMLTPHGPRTLEFNCRFGDPETQVILPLLDSDLYEIALACCEERLNEVQIRWKTDLHAVGVVMASRGYPETSTKGCKITGCDKVTTQSGKIVFHSGTRMNAEGCFETNGGRVLINVALGSSLAMAASEATAACEVIQFEGAQFRRDIGQKAIVKASYRASGVNIDAGEELVKRIKPLARGTNRAGVIGGLGGFGGLFRLQDVTRRGANGQETRYRDPVLVQGTDGVGTKLKIAEAMQLYETIGVDLVAMCVNDVLCNGAEPLVFLDYIACGQLEVPKAAMIVKGVAEACREAKCALVGGETAEMPYLYEKGKYDLAGYSLGVVENDDILPRMEDIVPGDVVIALPSSGVHSNGFSLVNRVMTIQGLKFTDEAPFSTSRSNFGKEFLTPTRIYVSELLPLVQRRAVKALAHITGGGLIENIPRVLPKHLAVHIDSSAFEVLPVFGWLAASGNVSEGEMLRTFNCGIGMIVICAGDSEAVQELTKRDGRVIGVIEKRSEKAVIVDNFTEALNRAKAPFVDAENIPEPITYRASGVDITAGDDFVREIKPLAKETSKRGVLGGLGSFGALFRLNEWEKKFTDPVLVFSTDGVGTKLKLAQEMKQHYNVGIDLVAMCVNDVACTGAHPLTFLDYYACGRLNVSQAVQTLRGVGEGCKRGDSALVGGETAEMPGIYREDEYDLAGFSLGVVERDNILPKIEKIVPGDVIIGLPSTGVHSNGFSLIHFILQRLGKSWTDRAPFSATGKSYGEEFLRETAIYVEEVQEALAACEIKAMAHITGGGLVENIPRVLPNDVKALIDFSSVSIPAVFPWLRQTGNVSNEEMLRTFNCGIGLALILHRSSLEKLRHGMIGRRLALLGSIEHRRGDENQVHIENFHERINFFQNLVSTPRRKVAVLISGNGSNLQALIDASRDSSRNVWCDICLVVSNKEGVFGLERAKKANIPSVVLQHRDFPTREAFDQAMSLKLQEQGIELVCLAGFMRILSEGFVRTWKGRLLNIHPSLLPRHKGVAAQKLALEAGDTVSGCTVHFVDEGVDTGAIITQESVPILPGDTVDSLSERIHRAEHLAFPKALELVTTGQVSLGGDGKTLWRSWK
ncbi:trifunctional purine biosynthetic protein adenosine-3 [Phlebotomus argentipes]|uniref:trifunctional purine biosynthetic protein adenosine-3 n=1 Tax=Phlebotomus argentipes TaxID=94469 RepID=UPI002893312A|nr:trifunctional purine biosynthetic protein adenosine-3 [Phlebotomus argentipes]